MKLTVAALLLASLVVAAANSASGQQLDHYLCYRASGPITIDGKLDEPSWQKAVWSRPFVHLVTGEPIPPMLESRAALLWDDTYLYVTITEKEEDAKAYMTERDDKIYADYMDAEVFIAASDTSDAYYEFEINARNTIYEVFWIWKDVFLDGSIWDDPEWDLDTQRVASLSGVGGHVHPRGARWGFLDWDFPGLITGVHVEGTLNDSSDVDTGWTVEVAFPWEGMNWLAGHRSLPPKAGDVWRIDCSRFGYGRVTPDVQAELPQQLGWAWNQHGYWDSHMPEMFTHVHFTTDGVEAAPQVLSATITPDTCLAGEPTPLEVTATVDLSPEAAASLRRILVDLSAVGGPSELVMADTGQRHYTASCTITAPWSGQYLLPVTMQSAYEWDTEGHGYRLATLKLEVYPGGDVIIYDDDPGPGWTVEVLGAESNTNATAFFHGGSFSHAILTPFAVKYVFEGPEAIELLGYTHLELWINGGDGSGQDPWIAGRKLSFWGVMVEPNTWKKVSIPASKLPAPLTGFYIGGPAQDRFYIDDMKLVAGQMPTAVEETPTAPLPLGYVLCENYPNPFNPQTVIRYALPEAGAARLCVYDVAGQLVRTLVDGEHSAGSHPAAWDGRDTTGREAASGVYLYRLEAEGHLTLTRRMVLLR